MNLNFLALGDLLHQLSDTDLAVLAKRVRSDAATPDALVSQYYRSEYIPRVLASLSKPALDVVRHWLVMGGLVRETNRDRDKFHAGTDELMEKGLLFRVRVADFRDAWVIPWDLYSPIFQHFFDLPIDTLSRPHPSGPRVESPASVSDPLFHDIFQVLASARRDPLKLTQQGDVYRRQKSKLEKLLWQDQSSSRLEARCDLILWCLQQEHLLTRRPSDFNTLTAPREIHVILGLPLPRLWDFLGNTLLDPSRVWGPFMALLALADALGPDRELTLPTVQPWLAQFGFHASRPEHLFEAQHYLQSIGLLEGCRLTPWGKALLQHHFVPEERGNMIIQPTGEVLVPPESPLGERWTLDEWATPVSSDRVSVYQLDVASCGRAMVAGYDYPEFHETLKAMSRTGIPGNVEANLENWFRQLGRHRIMAVTVVHSESAEDSQHVGQVLKTLMIDRLSSHDVIIAANSVVATQKALNKAGIPIVAHIEHPDVVDDDEEDYDLPNLQGMVWPVIIHPEDHSTQDAIPPRHVMEEMLRSALRHHRTVEISFRPRGQHDLRIMVVMPLLLNQGWLQAVEPTHNNFLAVEFDQVENVRYLES